MARGKVKSAPSSASRLLMVFLRAVQLISSCIVSGIVIYFVSLLATDKMSLPWTFIFLLVVSLLSFVLFFGSLCCGHALSKHPRASIVFSCVLSILWTVAFGLLGWWSRGTLGSTCNVDAWEEDQGVRICLLYKALFAFSLFGFLSTLFIVMLDLYFFRRITARGTYNKMPEDHHGLDNNNKPPTATSTTNLAYTSDQPPYSLDHAPQSSSSGRYYDNKTANAAEKQYEHQQEQKAEYALGENASYYDPHGTAAREQGQQGQQGQHVDKEVSVSYEAPQELRYDTSYQGHGAGRV